jgi:hypothetical protein
MSSPRPHSVTDLALSPVLVSIERNLARLRDNDDLRYALVLELNDDDNAAATPDDRVRRVLRAAVRNVELHGWTVAPTPDRYGLAVTHGEYAVSIMLGRRLADYVENGFPSAPADSRDQGPWRS